jgi:DNA-binding CsgD family transcriptional regulator
MTKAGHATAPNSGPADASGSVNAIVTRLRALVYHLGEGDDDGGSEQVLMDADLDGRRYILIRMPAIDRKQASLSPRELEIVRLVAEGHPNKVIAAVLEISSWTVCTHVRRVFAKLGVTSRAAMVARVAEFGGPMDVALATSLSRKPTGGGASNPGYRVSTLERQLGAPDPLRGRAMALSR